eukprot:6492301-Amphidinium_carterae.8
MHLVLLRCLLALNARVDSVSSKSPAMNKPSRLCTFHRVIRYPLKNLWSPTRRESEQQTATPEGNYFCFRTAAQSTSINLPTDLAHFSMERTL